MAAQDLDLPLSTVAKLAKDALPPGFSVAAGTKRALARAAAVFVLHTTALANELARDAGRGALSAADVKRALDEADMAEIRKLVEERLKAVKDHEKALATRRKRAKLDAAAAAATTAESAPAPAAAPAEEEGGGTGEAAADITEEGAGGGAEEAVAPAATQLMDD